MADLDDDHGSRDIVDRVDDPVRALTNSVAIVARQLLRAWRARIVRRRSFLVGRSSISREAERLSSRLYLSTPPQISNDALEGEARLGRSLFERGEVVRVLGETRTNRVVDEIRQGALGLGRLVTKRPVNLGLKIDGGPLGLSAHGPTIESEHHDVKTPQRNRRHSAVSGEMVKAAPDRPPTASAGPMSRHSHPSRRDTKVGPPDGASRPAAPAAHDRHEAPVGSSPYDWLYASESR